MSSNEHYKFPSTVKHRAYWHYRNASNVFDRLPRGKPEKPFEVYDLETTTDLTRVYLAGWYDGREYRYFESLPLPPDSPGSAVDQFCRWYFARKPMGLYMRTTVETLTTCIYYGGYCALNRTLALNLCPHSRQYC